MQLQCWSTGRLWVCAWGPDDNKSWWLLKVAFEALAKCTWLFFCNKVKAGTTPAALSFLKVRRVQTLGRAFSTLRPRDQVSRLVARPRLRRARWVQLLKVNNECIFLLRVTRLDDVDTLSATFCFQFLCRQRLVDTDETGQQFPFSTGNNTEVAFLSAGQQVLTGLAQHFTLASAIITCSLMPRALSTALTSRDPLLQWTISHLFHCQMAYIQ